MRLISDPEYLTVYRRAGGSVRLAMTLAVRTLALHTREGERYIRDGIAAMFRRSCVGTKEKPVDSESRDFGLRDLRAKGATDMYRISVDIRLIQHLLGHRPRATIFLGMDGPEHARHVADLALRYVTEHIR
jgi:integrase